MQTISLKPFHHRGQEIIGLYFKNDAELNLEVRKLPAVKWSQTNKCWYVPLSKESFEHLYNSLKEKATIDAHLLKSYLEKRKAIKATIAVNPKQNISKAIVQTSAWKISKENLAALNLFIQQLKLKAYSDSTIRTYKNEFLQLLQVLKKKHVNDLLPDDLRRYMVYAMEKKGIKESTAHSRLNALKFYFEQVLGREKFFWEIPRPKKPFVLPKVLSEYELSRLFNAAKYLKHKAILFTAYSAGLRVSEIISLQWKHIDRNRGQILIEQAKGKKDRYVVLSPILEDVLISYYRKSKIKPEKYVFESQAPGMPYSARSAQAVFQQAKEKAGIKKRNRLPQFKTFFCNAFA